MRELSRAYCGGLRLVLQRRKFASVSSSSPRPCPRPRPARPDRARDRETRTAIRASGCSTMREYTHILRLRQTRKNAVCTVETPVTASPPPRCQGPRAPMASIAKKSHSRPVMIHDRRHRTHRRTHHDSRDRRDTRDTARAVTYTRDKKHILREHTHTRQRDQTPAATYSYSV